MIKLYNTQTHQKEEFVPVEEGKVRMYVCGPTVYNRIHVGNARTFISFDTIRRYFIYRGYEVTFVQNVTDVDDKIITKANQEGRTAEEVAREFTDAFVADMRAAGVMDPDVRPKATKEIGEMIKLVKTLIDEGHAYATDEGDVYFSVRSFPEYGKLSGRNVDEMEGGHRELRADGQGLEDRKRDPLDFALWKAAKPGEPSWGSPWGQGRPGWHIECSAMSNKYLGLPLDIHGGGADLVFPHHENEVAQSEAACGCTFSNYWMHGGMLQVNHEKMSKSLGNFLLLNEVLQRTEPVVLRMLMLQTHYRSPLDFSDDRLEESAQSVGRIANALKNMDWALKNAQGTESGIDQENLRNATETLKTSFIEAMDDDFNTAGALGHVFTFVNMINANCVNKSISLEDAELVRAARGTLTELLGVLGLDIQAEEDTSDYPAETVELAAKLAGYVGEDVAEAAQALLEARAAARKAKDFATADAVRDGLTGLGFVIEDTPQGARVTFNG